MRDQHAELRGGDTNRLHRMHDTHHGGNNAERRHGVAELGDAVYGHLTFVVMSADFVVHQVFDLKRVQIAADHQSQVVGHKFEHMVVGENARVFGKQGTLRRFLDVALDGHQSLLTHLGKNVVEQCHQIHVDGFAVFRTLQTGGQYLESGLDRFAGIPDEKGARRGTAYHQKLEWLEQGSHVPAGQGEAAEHRAHHY